MKEVDFDDLPEPLPELDEGPQPEPVDDIQDALLDAIKTGAPTEITFDDLPEPLPELDEGPRPEPVDDIQDALFDAIKTGAHPEIEFDQLPEPGLTGPQKVIKSKYREPVPAAADTSPQASPAPQPAPPARPRPVLSSEAIPPLTYAEPDPVPHLADYWLILALFVVFRLLTLWLFRPGGFIRDWSDFDTYFGIAAMSDYGLYPFVHFWLEWPPIIPWLVVGAYRLSLLFPPWPDDPRLFFILIMGSVFLLFEVGNFILIYRLARRLFNTSTTLSRVMWLYAGLFPPVYAMLGFFDGVALFFMLLALELLLQERHFSSAITVGLGFMVKIIPSLLLPVALRRVWHQHRREGRAAWVEVGLYAVAFGLTIIVLLAPFLVSGPQWVRASARSMVGRSSWETVWAVAEGYYGFGVVTGDRLDPNETNFAINKTTPPEWFSPVWGLVTAAFAGLYLYLLTRPADYNQPRPLLALAGLTIALFLLYNKGYSPQFLVYLLPFILLFFPNGRGVIYALLFTGLNVLEQPIYFVLLPRTEWLLIFIVLARSGLLALIALEFALILWPKPVLSAWQQRVPPVLLGLGGIALLLFIPVLIQTYRADRLAHSPIAGFVDFIKIQTRQIKNIAGKPRLLLSDQATYRQLYPYLHLDFELQLTDGAAKQYSDAPRLVELLGGTDPIWVLPTGPQQETLSRAVSGRGQALASFNFEGVGTASLYGLSSSYAPFIAPARFSSGIELLGHQVTVESGAINVTLYWRALTPQTQSYKVFAQLLNADGQLVNNHDGIPVDGTAPTNTWTVGAVQTDPHRITLPSTLPPGQYTLITGLYNDFGDRLRGIDPDGMSLLNNAAPLEVIRLP